MKITTKFFLALGSIFLLVALANGVILFYLNALQSSFQGFSDTTLRLESLANDIRFYDSTLTDAVRAYLIDPTDKKSYDRYYQDAQALDQALAEAQQLATTDEDRNLFADINQANVQLVAIEERLLANPSLGEAIPLYRGEYGVLKARYASDVAQFFNRQHDAAGQQKEFIFSQISQALEVSLILIAVVLVATLGISLLLGRSIVNPLAALNFVTGQIAKGEWSIALPPSGRDEIGDLSNSFRLMVEQVRTTLASLDNRSRDLQTVADVNNQISTVLDEDRVLQDVVDLTKERFRLYHAHIYLVNSTGDTLVLTSGAGHVGRQMVAEVRTIAMNNPQSIVANAARSRKGVIINNVAESKTFLPHPLLPDTHSELAVPLVARGQLLGVLDVQSDKVGFFTQDMLSVIELLAGQIAVAISNARLYEIAERTSRHERALGNIDRKIQDAVDMDEILQITVRELGKALRVPYTAIELRLNQSSEQSDNQEIMS